MSGGTAARPGILKPLGIDLNLSSRAQRLAAVPDVEFEGMLGDWRGSRAGFSEPARLHA
jgi:hypothetical protein